MLNQNGFNLWADDYDKCVGMSDESGTYPFAGYREILNAIFCRILENGCKKVLDIGFGTATLASRLYERGCTIYGQDFSQRMLQLAGEKMPQARLYQGDFSQGLAPQITQERFDAIVASYSLHHLTDAQKLAFLPQLRTLLEENGTIYIADVAFTTRTELEQCRLRAGEEWDEDEIYFVYDELKTLLPGLRFEPFSSCAGLLTLQKR